MDMGVEDLVERLQKDAAMNLELPETSHLQNTGRLEIEAAEALLRLQQEISR